VDVGAGGELSLGEGEGGAEGTDDLGCAWGHSEGSVGPRDAQLVVMGAHEEMREREIDP
jgi:hypothetical protein